MMAATVSARWEILKNVESPKFKHKSTYCFHLKIHQLVKMSIFVTGFWILTVICVILYLYTRSATAATTDANFRSFQRAYLVVYLLAMGKCWWFMLSDLHRNENYMFSWIFICKWNNFWGLFRWSEQLFCGEHLQNLESRSKTRSSVDYLHDLNFIFR